ncbi:MAG: nucleotidyltransferase domain-containing protein [Candidatus Sumerlaeota bacterium]|nr:nucleotidyltransferase domain-containing protein [Candidatus Sumerlaeota bacterium]
MERQEILSILRSYKESRASQMGILAMGVFGSVARGDFREDSDVDICVSTQTPNPFILVHIKNDIERLLERHVDVVRLHEKMNSFLRERINKEGVYV